MAGWQPNGPNHQFPIHKVARAVKSVYRGANVTDACLATGIPRATWAMWLSAVDTWPDGSLLTPEALTFTARLRHAFTRAQALCAAKSQRLLLSAASKRVGELDWRAAHEHLKHADATRARWHEHRELKVEHSGQISAVHRQVRELAGNDEALLDLLPEEVRAEWRDLLPEHTDPG